MKRAFVDANVILRFLTLDPPDLAQQARDLFARVEAGELLLVLEAITVAELTWVLKSFYGYPVGQIRDVLVELLSHPGIECDERAGLMAALDGFAEKNVDFVDAWLAVKMAQQGVGEVYSFDGHFDRLPGVKRLAPG